MTFPLSSSYTGPGSSECRDSTVPFFFCHPIVIKPGCFLFRGRLHIRQRPSVRYPPPLSSIMLQSPLPPFFPLPMPSQCLPQAQEFESLSFFPVLPLCVGGPIPRGRHGLGRPLSLNGPPPPGRFFFPCIKPKFPPMSYPEGTIPFHYLQGVKSPLSLGRCGGPLENATGDFPVIILPSPSTRPPPWSR